MFKQGGRSGCSISNGCLANRFISIITAQMLGLGEEGGLNIARSGFSISNSNVANRFTSIITAQMLGLGEEGD
jgi:hypothetical protein